ncbi:MAG: hypothetical protein K6L60_01910 [Oceanobacter sp.]
MPRQTDADFVTQRRRFNRSWPLVAVGLLLLIGGMGIGVALVYPVMANPFYVVAQLQSGLLEPETLSTAAMLLPVLFWMLIICLLLFVLLSWQMMKNEKRLLVLLEAQQNTPPQ